MGASFSVAIEETSRALAADARQWLAGFYPHIRMSIDDTHLELWSDDHDSRGLATIWAVAIANEKLRRGAEQRRRAAFEVLTR